MLPPGNDGWVTFRKPLPPGTPATFAVRDAYRHGLTRAQLRNPEFARPFHGTRLHTSVSPSFEQRCRTLAERMRPGQSLSHTTAAMLHGMPLPHNLSSGPLHITSAAPGRASRARGVVGHSSALRRTDVGTANGLPVTSPARTWCDLAALLGLSELVAAGDYLLCWKPPAGGPPLLGRDDLFGAAAEHPSRVGRNTIREALPLLSAYSQSAPESFIRVALARSALPTPEPNLEVRLRVARRLVRFDLAYSRYKLALEYQGDHHRTDRGQWRSDIRRVNDAADDGWDILAFTADDTARMPELLARVERRLRDRGWRGGPN